MTIQEALDFEETFSSETFDSIKNAVESFLSIQQAKGTTLEFQDKTVYMSSHDGIVEIHIVSGDNNERPKLPGLEDDE